MKAVPFSILAGLALAVAVSAASPAAAEVGNYYVTAYSRTKAAQSDAGRYGAQLLIKTKGERAQDRKKSPGGAAYSETFQLCKRTWYTTARGKRWIAAHRRAKHVLVVRRHVAKGRYRVVCGTIPKAQSPKAKPKTTGKKKSS